MLPSACSFFCRCFTVLHLVVAVLHYMFRLHGHLLVCVMFYFYIPERICFAVFVAFSFMWLYYARFHLWGGLNMMYYYLLLLMLLFCSVIVYIYIYIYLCFYLLVFCCCCCCCCCCYVCWEDGHVGRNM
jgi:hypothetical protein